MIGVLLQRLTPHRQRQVAALATYALFVIGPAAILVAAWTDGPISTAAIAVACATLIPVALLFLPSPIDGLIAVVELVRIFFSPRGAYAMRIREPAVHGPFVERSRRTELSVAQRRVLAAGIGAACLTLGAFGLWDGIELEREVRADRSSPQMEAEVLDRRQVSSDQVELRARGLDPTTSRERTVTVRVHERETKSYVDLYRIDGEWTPKVQVDDQSFLAWMRMIAGGFLVLAGVTQLVRAIVLREHHGASGSSRV